jgi:hypothetical protein
MITYLINQAILILFNLINSRIDAYRIMKNKTIAHAINFGLYVVCVGLIIWLFKLELWSAVLFSFSAFFNRQLSFDIPLNLRRGKKWDYVSLDKPPKALLDRIEIRLWGYNGKAPVFCYATAWLLCLAIKFFL